MRRQNITCVDNFQNNQPKFIIIEPNNRSELSIIDYGSFQLKDMTHTNMKEQSNFQNQRVKNNRIMWTE